MSLSDATLTCYCKNISVPLSNIAKHTTFSLPIELCHCNTCRYASGALSGAFFELKGAPDDAILAKCTEYASSSKVSRYFCPKCGSKLFIRGWGVTVPILWFAWPGAITRADTDKEDTVKVSMQVFFNDSIDGGLLGRMVEVGKQRGTKGHDMGEMFSCIFPDFPSGPTMSFDEIDESITASKAAAAESLPQGSDRLLAKCRCGGVQFHVTRPNQPKQYSDDVQFYLKQNNTKYLARFCTCWSCCASLGNPLTPWAYVPPENIVAADGSPVEFGAGENSLAQLPGIRKIKNDEGVIRSFCGTCGATFFYEHVERGWVIDISAGLFRSEKGSWADDWLEWEFHEVSWSEECRVKELLEGVTGKAW